VLPLPDGGEYDQTGNPRRIGNNHDVGLAGIDLPMKSTFINIYAAPSLMCFYQ
jgi:hypothetical protein